MSRWFPLARAGVALCVWLLSTCAAALLAGDHSRAALHVVSLLQQPRFETLVAVRDWGLAAQRVATAEDQRQQSPNDCGPVALQRLLLLHGTAVPDDPAWRPRLRADGCSLVDLHRAARQLGLPTTMVRDARVIDRRPPVLLHLRRRHFVVLEARQHNRLHLFDPAHGLLRVDRRQLQRATSGWGLIAAYCPPAPDLPSLEVQ